MRGTWHLLDMHWIEAAGRERVLLAGVRPNILLTFDATAHWICADHISNARPHCRGVCPRAAFTIRKNVIWMQPCMRDISR